MMPAKSISPSNLQELKTAEPQEAHMGIKAAVGTAVASTFGAMSVLLGSGAGALLGAVATSGAAVGSPVQWLAVGGLGAAGAILGAAQVPPRIQEAVQEVQKRIGSAKDLTWGEKLKVWRSTVASVTVNHDDYYTVEQDRQNKAKLKR